MCRGHAPSTAAQPRSKVAWDDALSPQMCAITDLEQTMQLLQVKLLDNMQLVDANNERNVLGKVYWSWGTTVSAACQGNGHGRCKLFLRAGGGRGDWCQADLVKWLVAGRTCAGAEEHVALGNAVKVLHGMKPRQREG